MRRLSPRSLSIGICALILSACGGGGSGGGPAGIAPVPAPSKASSGVTLSIKLPSPPAGTPAARHRLYVSPNTQSVGVVVTNQGFSPTPAQYVNVSSCPPVNGVTTCSVTILAQPGTDVFAISTYSGQNGTGSVLSAASITATIVTGSTTPIAASLGGVISSIAIVPAASTLPLGQSTTLNISAKDASGATIVGAYDNPIVLTGSNLVLSATSFADSTSASKVNAAWSYGFTGSAATTLSATADGVTGTAPIAPGTGIAFWQTGTNPATDVTSFKMIAGSNGKLYYTTLGVTQLAAANFVYATSGAVHQFDPATNTDTEVDFTTEAAGMFFTSDGALWIAGGTVPSSTSPLLYRMAPGSFSSSAVTPIAVPTASPAPAFYSVRSIAQDGSGNIWFQDMGGKRYFKMPVGGPYTMSSITPFAMPTGPPGTTPGVKGVSRNVRYDGGVLMVMDGRNGVIDTINPATGALTGQYPTNLQTSLANPTIDWANGYDATGDGTSAYVAQLGPASELLAQGQLEKFNPSTHTFTTLPFVSGTSGVQPTVPSVSGSLLYVADFAKGSLDVVNLSAGTDRSVPLYPLGSSFFTGAANVAALPDGTAWFSCFGNSAVGVAYSQPMCVGHTVYLSNWTIWPSNAITLNGGGLQGGQLIGIMENPAANTGPFQVTSQNPAICSIANASDHNFIIEGVSPGACTVSVTDKNNLTQTINVTVNQTVNGVVQGRERGESL